MAKKPQRWPRPQVDQTAPPTTTPPPAPPPEVKLPQPPAGEALEPATVTAELQERATPFVHPALPSLPPPAPAVQPAPPPVENPPVVPMAPPRAPVMAPVSHASQVLHSSTPAPAPQGPTLDEQREKNASGLLASYTKALIDIQTVAGDHPTAEQQKMNLVLYQKIINLLLNSKIESLYGQFLQFMVEQTPTKLMGEDYLFKGMRQVEPAARDRIMFFYMVFRNLHAFKYYGKPWTMHLDMIRQRLRNDTLITFLGRTLRR